MRALHPVWFSLTACVAAVLFSLLNVPLGAMIGPMLGIAMLSHLTKQIVSPGAISHDAAILMIGLALGSQVSADLFSQIILWPASLTVLIVTMVLILWLGGRLNQRMLSLDPVSAHMAAAPGNLSSALAVTEHYGGALSQVAVYQSLRLAFLTLLVPFFFTIPESTNAPVIFTADDFKVWILMLSVGWICTQLFKSLSITTPGLIAGVCIAGTVSGFGWARIQTPELFIGFAMMLFGWRIGTDTLHQGLRVLIKTIPAAAASTAFALVCALLGAYCVHRLLGFPLMDAILGFMPGAFQVMPVIALATGADGLYVTTHHLVRVLAMGAIIPLSAPYWNRT